MEVDAAWMYVGYRRQVTETTGQMIGARRKDKSPSRQYGDGATMQRWRFWTATGCLSRWTNWMRDGNSTCMLMMSVMAVSRHWHSKIRLARGRAGCMKLLGLSPRESRLQVPIFSHWWHFHFFLSGWCILKPVCVCSQASDVYANSWNCKQTQSGGALKLQCRVMMRNVE